jgi:4-hydroxybenzoate polyprenyltransferase
VSLGLSLTSLLNASATILLVTYLALTLTYTFYLKRVAILDVFVIAALFTLRLAMGVAITGVRLSPWLMVFSMFSFLSLCLAKRYTEILGLTANDPAATARGYMTADAPLILALGVAAALGSILIFVLYLIEDAFPQNLYSSPYFLWAPPCILFLLFSRMWLVAQRRVLNDDPVEFVLTDPQSLGLGIAALLTIALALA